MENKQTNLRTAEGEVLLIKTSSESFIQIYFNKSNDVDASSLCESCGEACDCKCPCDCDWVCDCDCPCSCDA